MTTVYLGLGSNLGARSRNLSAARRRLLQYLQKRDLEGYRALIQELGLRR